MKKLVITLSLLAGVTAAYSQGQINWSDYQPANNTSSPPLPAFLITVWTPGTETSGTGSVPNNTANDLPAGTATYTGQPAGAGYEVGLYVDTSPTAVANDVATGTPVTTLPFGTGANAGGWDFSGTLFQFVPGIASGTAVYVELAAWSTADGATSYSQALSQQVAAGTSGASTGTTVLGGGGSPPATPGTLAGIGLQDFQLSTIPEPSTIALGVIGASTFLLRLRRKQ